MDNANESVRTEDEVQIVISDLHLSAGVAVDPGYRRSRWRRFWSKTHDLMFGPPTHVQVHRLNPLEDFPDDGVVVSFLETVEREYGQAPKLVLRLLGDTFDPLAVTLNGRFVEPPYEATAAIKMRKIIVGHPAFFDALARFLDDDRHRLDIFVGNHDLPLVWPAVQKIVRRRLRASLDSSRGARLRFIDHQQEFYELDRGVLFGHGGEAEAQNYVNPKKVIVRKRFGLPLKRPHLDLPIGSQLSVDVQNPIKLKNPMIGRLVNYRHMFRNAFLHRWGWITVFMWSVVWYFLIGRAIAWWRGIGHRPSLQRTFQIIFQSIANDAVDDYAKRLMKKRGARAIVIGHSHEPHLMATDAGTYINTGSWTLKFELVMPQPELRWQRWRWLEIGWRNLQHFWKTGQVQSGSQLVRIIGWAAAIVFCAAGIAAGLLEEAKSGTLQWADLIGPALVALPLLLAGGLMRLVTARPSVVSHQQYTFAVVRFAGDELVDLRLCRYWPESRSFTPYM